jgi:hypothetical protein
MIPPRGRSRSLRRFGALAAFVLLGCHNLDGFDTKPGQAYCGTIAGTPFQEGFLNDNEPPDLALALTLDTSKLTSEPGILSSNSGGICGDQPLFQDAPLRAIPAVDRDAISTLTFGEGHEHDFFAWVDSTCQGTMLAVVSLMKNNQVEMRLFKPARLPPPDALPAQQPGFAVFHLQVASRADAGVSAKDSCGF